ncbi:hypothetical protein YC2023_049270 [Brassica napus]
MANSFTRLADLKAGRCSTTTETSAQVRFLLGEEGEETFYTTYAEVCDTFDAMELRSDLPREIYAYEGFCYSAERERGVIPFCNGIQQAQSGTGKTATFCSGFLQQLDYTLGDYLGVKVHAYVGGTSVREDQRILQSGVHVVVGTPGRVRQSLRADAIKMVDLDEADEMISRDLKDQIYDIFQLLPSKFQVGVLSATMQPEALEIKRKFMNKTVRILVKCDELTFEGIKQF